MRQKIDIAKQHQYGVIISIQILYHNIRYSVHVRRSRPLIRLRWNESVHQTAAYQTEPIQCDSGQDVAIHRQYDACSFNGLGRGGHCDPQPPRRMPYVSDKTESMTSTSPILSENRMVLRCIETGERYALPTSATLSPVVLQAGCSKTACVNV